MSAPRKSHRRDFLKGKAAARAAEDLVDRVAPAQLSDPSRANSPGGYLLHFSRRAMACRFQVMLDAARYRQAGEAAIEALDLVDELEAQMTVYRDDSEISRLNARAADEPVEVEPQLFDLLRRAVELHEQTDGAFDITSGLLSKVWGFSRREGRMPREDDLAPALNCTGSRHLRLDAERSSVGFDRQGLEINLGSIGKGYALDRAAEVLHEQQVNDFIWHGGQSSVLAAGSGDATVDNDDGEPGWTVGIRHPIWKDRRVAEIRLCDAALATSGSGSQYFHHAGRRYGHILDPRSGHPAAGVLSSTVIAPTAAEADALATALYVMGAEVAMQYCGDHPDIAALLVTPGKRRGSIATHAAGFSEGQLFMVDTPNRP
ncbi:MAG: FAD:protein FMN transferase [Planctomycetes bacterium]|nr:FAD:protein FMN transferase [Planctomycetota bacterium]